MDRGAGATVAAIDIPSEEASRFGVLNVDDRDLLTGFLEPKNLPGGRQVLASMGIYVFDMNVLVPALEEDARRSSSHDFGKDILPALISRVPVRVPVQRREQEDFEMLAGHRTLDAY